MEAGCTQGAKKVIFTACHSGKLNLTFTSPNIISTSPKNVLMSRLISQFFRNLNSSKNYTCLSGKQRIQFTSLIAHYFLCTLLQYKTTIAQKNSAFCSVTTYHRDIVLPKEHLYKQMACNPTFIEREVYKEPMLISQRDKEAGWPSGHCLGLAIRQSRVEVPL